MFHVMQNVFDYPTLANGLLEQASIYDQEHWNDEIDDGGFHRCEALRAWVESQLKTKITDESAMSINRHTAHPGEIEVEELAEQLPSLLDHH